MSGRADNRAGPRLAWLRARGCMPFPLVPATHTLAVLPLPVLPLPVLPLTALSLPVLLPSLQEDERILRKLLSKVRKSAEQVSARGGRVGGRALAMWPGCACLVATVRLNEQVPAKAGRPTRQAAAPNWRPLARWWTSHRASPTAHQPPAADTLRACVRCAARRARCGWGHRGREVCPQGHCRQVQDQRCRPQR